MPASSVLKDIIDRTTLSRLQGVVKKICDASPSTRALFEQELLDSTTTTSIPTATNIIDLTNENEAPNQQQVDETASEKRQRYAMCKHCNVEFDVTDNAEEDCQYHDGTLEIDWDGDFWADHDEDCHGKIDLDLAEEYPEGFIWTCCKENGEGEGCQIGPHEVDETYKPKEVKKRRF